MQRPRMPRCDPNSHSESCDCVLCNAVLYSHTTFFEATQMVLYQLLRPQTAGPVRSSDSLVKDPMQPHRTLEVWLT